MQKKLMLRPTAVPSEHLPSEMMSYIERPDSPDNTSSSFVSLEQHSDSSTTGNLITPQSTPIVTNGNGNMNGGGINNNNSTILINNNNNLNHNHHTTINNNGTHHSEYQEEVNVKLSDNFSYHQNSAPIIQATNVVTYQQPSTYETLLTPLSTVPYQEINEAPMYLISDGTEIDQNRLASVLNKDGDYGDGTITYVVNFVDY